MSVLLLSGGIDSLALMFWQRPTLAITIDYGQLPARSEVGAAAYVCQELKVPHEVISIDCSSLGLGDLAGKKASPLGRASEWWPFRNQFLVTIAVMRMAALTEKELLLGSVRSDQVHADGTKEFYTKIGSLVAIQEGQFQISAPCLELSSEELVINSGIPNSLLGWAHSCHRGNTACGSCRGCVKHQEVFERVGLLPTF